MSENEAQKSPPPKGANSESSHGPLRMGHPPSLKLNIEEALFNEEA